MKQWMISVSLFLLSFSAQTVPASDLLTPMAAQTAPDFSLTDIDGNGHQLSALRGKVVIVNFWATWCPPCREEMPSMQRAWEQLQAEGVVMLAINVGEDVDTIFRFTADYPVDFPLLLDQDSATINRWPVKGLPSTFVIDTEGRLVYRAIGGREWDAPAILEAIRALAR